jgi:hypothetical protein
VRPIGPPLAAIVGRRNLGRPWLCLIDYLAPECIVAQGPPIRQAWTAGHVKVRSEFGHGVVPVTDEFRGPHLHQIEPIAGSSPAVWSPFDSYLPTERSDQRPRIHCGDGLET